jgi:hypothetical protein
LAVEEDRSDGSDEGLCAMDTIPTLKNIDSTLGFMRDGYLFASKRCRDLGADAFHTRLAGRPVTFMLGADASRTFWSGDRLIGTAPFRRRQPTCSRMTAVRRRSTVRRTSTGSGCSWK